MNRITCFLLQPTGKMTEFVDGIASPIYVAADGQEYHVGYGIHPECPKAPEGAMWIPPIEGVGLVVRTPAGDWYVDHGNWMRTGELPNITVTPSIRFLGVDPGSPDRYHGWLRNGVLEEC